MSLVYNKNNVKKYNNDPAVNTKGALKSEGPKFDSQKDQFPKKHSLLNWLWSGCRIVWTSPLVNFLTTGKLLVRNQVRHFLLMSHKVQNHNRLGKIRMLPTIFPVSVHSYIQF